MAQSRPVRKKRSPLEMPFPYQNAFGGNEYQDFLKAIKESKFAERGVVYIRQLPTYTAALPYHWEHFPEVMVNFIQKEILDKSINRSFEKEGLINWSSTLPTLYPLVTTGDGNCLLHAVSLYMWGFEDTDMLLRTCLFHTLNSGPFAAQNMKRWQYDRSTTDAVAMGSGFRYNTGEWNQEFEMLKSMSSPDFNDDVNELAYRSLEEFHIYVLANILRRPIIVLASEKVRSVNGASLQLQLVSGMYLPLHWDPSFCFKYPIVLGFNQSHFFPLIHTAPDNSIEEGELMVPLVHPFTTGMMKVHFLLPDDDPDTLMRTYLNVDTFIHCPKNKETAVGLIGAKLNCTSLGNFDVWKAYFELAEIKQRDYYEREYNPDSEMTESNYNESEGRGMSEHGMGALGGVGVPDEDVGHQYITNNPVPVAAPVAREQGQCKTTGCPFQRSLSTGELCVECFNKGQREKCRSTDCLNKADVGMNGFCKVCHDGNKFQESNTSNKSRSVFGSSYRESSPVEDRFGTTNGDLNSIAVDMVRSGMQKCIVPECELTGTPQTNDMCSVCYKQNMEVVQQLSKEETKQSQNYNLAPERHTAGEQKLIGSTDPYARHTEMLKKLELNEPTRPERRELDRQKDNFAPERHIAGEQTHIGSTNPEIFSRHTEMLKKLERRELSRPQDDRVEARSAPLPLRQKKITVQKDLCATAGCSGIRLRDKGELCRGCRDEEENARKPPNDNQNLLKDHYATAGANVMPQAQPRKNLSRASETMDDRQRHHHHSTYASSTSQSRDGQAKHYSQNEWQQGPYNAGAKPHRREEQQFSKETPGKCRIRRCQEMAVPPDYRYCRDCLEDILSDPLRERYALQTPAGSDPQYLRAVRPADLGQTSPSRMRTNVNRDPDRDGSIDATSRHIDQQLREQYRPDKSDSSPTDVTRNVIPPELRERIICQRPGGCPEDMYGDPTKNDLCSKCWKEVGQSGQHREQKFQRNPERDTAGIGYQQDLELLRFQESTHPAGQEQAPTINPRRADTRYQQGRELKRYDEGPITRSAPVDLPRHIRGQYVETERSQYLNYRERIAPVEPVSPVEHLYEELPDTVCAQPGCKRPSAVNVEKFCTQCHHNYMQIFVEHRQINQPGLHGN